MRQFDDIENLDERVDAYVQRQKRIARFVFLGVNAVLFFIFAFVSLMVVTNTPELASLSEDAQGALIAGGILLTTGWAMSLLFQFISAIFDTGIGDASMRQQALTRVMAEHMLETSRLRRREKTKRGEDYEDGGRMVLGEDGELVELQAHDGESDHLMEEYYNQQEQRRQRR